MGRFLKPQLREGRQQTAADAGGAVVTLLLSAVYFPVGTKQK